MNGVNGEDREISALAEADELIASLAQRAQQTSSGKGEGGLAQILPLVYEELRQLASSYLRHERPGHTLQPTALVHEAYMRLLDQHSVRWENRGHLLAISARLMRRILLQHAQARRAEKRGAGAPKLSLDLAVDAFEQRDLPIETLNAALRDLEQLNPRQAQIVELRFFGGLTVDEAADVLGISPKTVKRQWAVAKLWLQRELARQN